MPVADQQGQRMSGQRANTYSSKAPGCEAAKRNAAIMAWFIVCMTLCLTNTDTQETARCTPHSYNIFYISGHVKQKQPLRATRLSVTFRGGGKKKKNSTTVLLLLQPNVSQAWQSGDEKQLPKPKR